jgi:hypothetical protein
MGASWSHPGGASGAPGLATVRQLGGIPGGNREWVPVANEVVSEEGTKTRCWTAEVRRRENRRGPSGSEHLDLVEVPGWSSVTRMGAPGDGVDGVPWGNRESRRGPRAWCPS